MEYASLAQEFEAVKLKDMTRRINDTKALQDMCCKLIDLNYNMKKTFADVMQNKWLGE